MIATIGKVIEQPGSLTIQTARPDAENLSDTVTVLWQDCRTISPEQRRKAWALIGEIAAATGYIGQSDKSDLNTMLKADFDAKYHIQPVKIDEKIAKLYKLGGKSNKQADNYREFDAGR